MWLWELLVTCRTSSISCVSWHFTSCCRWALLVLCSLWRMCCITVVGELKGGHAGGTRCSPRYTHGKSVCVRANRWWCVRWVNYFGTKSQFELWDPRLSIVFESHVAYHLSACTWLHIPGQSTDCVARFGLWEWQWEAKPKKGWQGVLLMVLVAAWGSIEDMAQLQDECVGLELVVVVGQHLPHWNEAAEVDAPWGNQLGILSLWPEPQLHQHSWRRQRNCSSTC